MLPVIQVHQHSSSRNKRCLSWRKLITVLFIAILLLLGVNYLLLPQWQTSGSTGNTSSGSDVKITYTTGNDDMLKHLLNLQPQSKINFEKQQQVQNPRKKSISTPIASSTNIMNPSGGRLVNLNKKNAVVLVMTATRDAYLRQCLQSLYKLEGIDHINVVVSQDSRTESVKAVVEEFQRAHPELEFWQHEQDWSAPHHQTALIARHYKWALGRIFERFEYVIIVEEDMIFSADFFHYFDQTAPLLDDPSIWCISSWNDFGFPHLAHDMSKLLRTQFFPGLGWMTSATIWNKMLRPIFPLDSWDYALRVSSVYGNKSCIFPQISRNYNIGSQGSNTQKSSYDLYMRDIQYNADLPFVKLDIDKVRQPYYSQNIARYVDMVIHASKNNLNGVYQQNSINNIKYYYLSDTNTAAPQFHVARVISEYNKELHNGNNNGNNNNDNSHNNNNNGNNNNSHNNENDYNSEEQAPPIGIVLVPFERERLPSILPNFQLPYHELRCHDQRTLLLDYYLNGQPQKPSSPAFDPYILFILVDVRHSPHTPKTHRILPHPKLKVRTAPQGVSCEQLCKCQEDQFDFINKCETLMKHFPCKTCRIDWGSEIPVYVTHKDDRSYLSCLITLDEIPQCRASHKHTSRLCPCIDE